jgi:hypothetical protein
MKWLILTQSDLTRAHLYAAILAIGDNRLLRHTGLCLLAKNDDRPASFHRPMH